MSEDTLLSSLCAICHVNVIKYTCPRCSIHTCSLPCVRKHKQWAQCSGIRDPAEYRKRSDLETASSVDKDFNFITKVERSLQRADNNALARDLATSLQRRARPQEQRTKVEIEIEQRGVTVIRAPAGLTRHRQNKTHWANQHKCLMWTIEWVCPDGQKIVGQGLESKHVGEAFVNAIGKKSLLRKRKRNELPRSLEFLHGKISDVTTTDYREIDQPNRSNGIQLGSDTERVRSGDTSLPEIDVSKTTETNINHTSIEPGLEDPLAGLNFYLHRPNTSAQIKCLVHLRPNDSIGKSLEKRTVLEFPTIYVKTEKPAQLPVPFVEETDYLAKYDTGTRVNEKLPLEEGEIDDAHQIPDVLFHESKVVEVLAKDLSGSSHV